MMLQLQCRAGHKFIREVRAGEEPVCPARTFDGTVREDDTLDVDECGLPTYIHLPNLDIEMMTQALDRMPTFTHDGPARDVDLEAQSKLIGEMYRVQKIMEENLAVDKISRQVMESGVLVHMLYLAPRFVLRNDFVGMCIAIQYASASGNVP